MTIETSTQYDLARSILSALTYSEGNIPYKCHINKLNNRASFFGFTNGIKDYLENLESIGEAYNAGEGYWSSSPTRNISVGKFWLIISSLPTIHFPKTIKCRNNIGIGRISETLLPNVEIQNLHDWMRVPGSLDVWIKAILKLAQKNLTPSTLTAEDHEFFVPWNSDKSNNKNGWVPYSKISASSNEILLTRSISYKPRHYFWGSWEGKKLLESRFPVNLTDIPRLKLALEMLHAYSRTAYAKTENRQIKLEVNFDFPRQEESLLLALASKSQMGYLKQYVYSSEFESTIEVELTKLGINYRRN